MVGYAWINARALIGTGATLTHPTCLSCWT